MEPNLYSVIFLIGVIAPVLFYSGIALKSYTKPSINLDDVLLAGKSATGSDYVDSSTGYMLQVSTTFYFVYWGYNYGFSNIFYLVAWAAGIILFSRFSEPILKATRIYETIPSFLSAAKFDKLRYTTSIISIVAFLGVFYVEAHFTTGFLETLSGKNSGSEGSWWWVYFVLIVLLTISYSMIGGMKKIIDTDKYQLSFAYLGFAVVFCYLLPRIFENNTLNGIVLTLILLGLFGTFYYFERANRYSFKSIVLVISISLILLSSLYSISLFDYSFHGLEISGLFKQVKEPWGAVTLLGFTILNVLWQFCDNSNFQRIASLKLDEDDSIANREVRSCIKSLTVVSPLTWGLGILLGMAISVSGFVNSDPGQEYNVFLDVLHGDAMSGNPIAMGTIVFLTIALISIMMSTADSAIIASAQTCIRDLLNYKSYSSSFPIKFGLLTLIFIGLIAFCHSIWNESSILTVMAGVYSALIVLSLPVLLKLKGVSLPNFVVLFSVVLGFVLTWFGTFGSFDLPLNIVLVLPIFCGTFGSFMPIMAYLTFSKFRNKVL